MEKFKPGIMAFQVEEGGAIIENVQADSWYDGKKGNSYKKTSIAVTAPSRQVDLAAYARGLIAGENPIIFPTRGESGEVVSVEARTFNRLSENAYGAAYEVFSLRVHQGIHSETESM